LKLWRFNALHLGIEEVNTFMTDRNPRGEKRRRDGSGRGVGRPGGRRGGRNPNPCKSKRRMGDGKGQNR